MSDKDNIGNNKNAFRTDSDYFDNFSNRLMKKIEGFEEIKVEAPILSSVPKYNPFDVPVGYFDELPTIVQQRCTSTSSKNNVLEWLRLLIKPNFAIPVLIVVAIAFAGIKYIHNTNVEKISTPLAEEISIDDALQNIDESTIVEALTAENISLDATTISSSEVSTKEESEIKNYLLENNIDEQNLNTEL